MKIGFSFPIFGGGQYYNSEGKLVVYKMWWPILIMRYVDWILRTLVGKEGVGFMSTVTVISRSANTHTPRDQKISITFVDHETTNRMIWGTDLNAEAARFIASRLVILAEEIEPFYTTEENRRQVRDNLNETLKGEEQQ